MRASAVSPDEQYQIIMECCSSGLSDHQWCLEHGIKSGTFYNWVKRLRQKGCSDLPVTSRQSNIKQSLKQDVVKLDFSETESSIFEASDMECQSHLSEKMQSAIIWLFCNYLYYSFLILEVLTPLPVNLFFSILRICVRFVILVVFFYFLPLHTQILSITLLKY